MSVDYIKCGDCLELMNEIPDSSVDMVLCDLPYGITYCMWDSIIPFEPLWKQYNRVVKDNGAIVLFAAQPFTSIMVSSNIKNYKHHWIWLKNRATGFQCARFRPMMATEDIIAFSKNKSRIRYKPQMIPVDKPYTHTGAKSLGINPNAKFRDMKKIYTHKFPNNVLNFAKVTKPQHPTQKPVPLLEYLIKTYTNEGDAVLDNCMGSGSTCVACINTNRHYIGMDLSEEYCTIAQARIDNALQERGNK